MKLVAETPTPEMIKAGRNAAAYAKCISADEIPLIFSAMYAAAPKVVQEPVAHVYRNEYWTVFIDQQCLPSADSFPVFAYPTDAQAEIRERDARITRLENELADALDLKEGNGPTVLAMQATEISRLKALVEKCKALLPTRISNGFVSLGKYYSEQEDIFVDSYNHMSKFKKKYLNECEEVLAAIKEIEHV